MTISLGKAVLEILTDPSGFNLEKPKTSLTELAGISKNTALVAGAAFTAMAVATTAVAAGVIAVGREIVELGTRGAMIADVRSSFDALSTSAGQTADVMLGSLRRGTANTVSDFELMKLANKAMGAGLVATADDFETLAAGARLLANRTGGETADAFDTLTSAMASGRTAQLKQLGLFVDNKAAVEAFARANRVSVGDMTDADRATALQAATLATLREELRRNGVDAADFGDRIDKLKASFANFMDGLAEAIAASPVVAAGMEAIGISLDGAFGSDQQQMIQNLIQWVNEFAIAVARTGQIVVESVVVMVGGLSKLVEINAQIAESAAALPLVGEKYQEAAANARKQATAVAAISGTLSDLKSRLDTVVPAMEAARAAQDHVSAATDAGARSAGRAGEAAERLAASQKAAAERAKQTAEEYRAYISFLGEREIENHKRIQAAKMDEDAAYRAFRDMLGQRELEHAAQVAADKERIDAEYRAYQDMLGQRELEANAAKHQAISERAAALGMLTRDELERSAATALATYQAMKDSGEFTAQTLQEAWTRYETARRAASDQTKEMSLDNALTTVQGTLEIFGRLGKAFKVAAIAGAIIATYMAIAKALANSPWPWNLVAAAGAAAAGFANVAKIKAADEGFRFGTPGLDFKSFGPGRMVALHGDEAVIPRSGSHELARVIAASLADQRPGASGQIVIQVDGRNSFYQNLGDMQRLADVVGKAVVSQLGLTVRLNTV